MSAGRGRRALRRLGTVLIATLAIAAVAASAASARAWTVEGATLTGSKTIECSTAHPILFFAELAGIPIELEATGVECLEGSIFNVSGVGKSSFKLRFTGVSFLQPEGFGCEVPGGTLTTNQLSAELVEVAGDSHLFDKKFPAGGTEYITVPIEECVLAGEYPIEGSIAGEGKVWGEESATQPLTFGSAVDAKTGFGLSFGGEPLTLTGSFNFVLSAREEFGAS